jgi:phosphate transport system substrate-binding protein
MIKKIALLSLVLFILGSCNREPRYHKKKQLKGNISISGAFALYPLAVLWAEEFMKIYPDVEIDISAGGAGKDMADVLNGMVDIGMVSRSINLAEFKKGAWNIALVKDAVLPTISSNNPFIDSLTRKGITREQLKCIFINETIKDWGTVSGDLKKNNTIHVFTRSDACGAGEMWGKYLGSDQEAIQGVGVFGDPGMADAVRNEPASIGYNNVIYAYDLATRGFYQGIQVLPIDLNNNRKIDPEEDFYNNLDSLNEAIREGKYPSPPGRELYFVCKGKPKKTVIKEFLKWILTDGQKYIRKAGYVELSEKHRLDELAKIKFSIRRSFHLKNANIQEK